MTLTELPLQMPGRLFRSPMPFSEFDRGGRLLDLFKLNEISVVVVLAEQEECLALRPRARLSIPIHGNRPLKVGLLKHLLKMAKLPEDAV